MPESLYCPNQKVLSNQGKENWANIKWVKQYAWYEWPKAIEESGKSVAELYDFKTGTLIDKG